MIWKSDIWATGEVFVANAFFFSISHILRP